MAKTLDLSRTVHDLVADYPELRDVMASIGFPDIAKPMALNTVGRVMTIPKGCAIKELDLDQVRSRLEAAGFIVVDGETGEAGATEKAGVTEGQPDAADSEPGTAAEKTDASASDPTDRASLLKSYVGRLTSGEDLESVQADFAAHFQDVDATEIMDAEQQLIAEGAPLPEVTRLCDVHSALFHGATREEIDGAATSSMIDKAAAAVEAAFAQQDGAFAQHDGAFAQHDGAFAQDSVAQPAEAASEVARNHAAADAHTTDAARLVATPGHPLNVLTSENDAIASHIAAARTALDAGDHETAVAEIHELRQIGNHYRKKGDLLYPLLANRYEVTGPSNVMWTVDGEIRDGLRDLAARPDVRDWDDRARAVLKRADEMIYKEANILFPICAANFTEEEWENLAFDISEYAPCLIESDPLWSEAKPMPAAPAKADGTPRPRSSYLRAPSPCPSSAPCSIPSRARSPSSAPTISIAISTSPRAPRTSPVPSPRWAVPSIPATRPRSSPWSVGSLRSSAAATRTPSICGTSAATATSGCVIWPSATARAPTWARSSSSRT